MFTSRFAPSPTGLLHLGHAYSALLTNSLVTENCGVLELRIEDIDQSRCTSVFENQIYDDLNWLGINWNKAPLKQSERLGSYSKYIQKLANMGLLYSCDCTRSDIKNALSAPNAQPKNLKSEVYPGLCREKNLSPSGRNIRLNVLKAKEYLEEKNLSFVEKGVGPNGDNGLQFFSIDWIYKNYGDFIIARKDIKTSYHLSVTIDDANQNITHISRGNDLFYVTALHVLLQRLLNLKTPTYLHHSLILDSNGKKLSKSKGAESILSLRNSGKTLKDVKFTLGLL